MPSYDKCPKCACSIVLTPTATGRKCFLCGHEWDEAEAEAAAAEPAAQ